MYDFSDYVASNNNFWDKLVSNGMYQCLIQWFTLALLIAILAVAIFILINVKRGAKVSSRISMSSAFTGNTEAVCFCKKCGNECSADDVVCSKCGTKRR